jgi:tetratricopeptide (TPR) repeat protein
MQRWAFLLLISTMAGWLPFSLAGQSQGDTTIYSFAEHMPRFPICEGLDTTLAIKKKCADEAFLAFMYENIRYPAAALQENLEGIVVLSFVVEKNGFITQPSIVKDIGGGCGEEALRVIAGMQQMGMRWVPAVREGDTVRARLTVPLRFRIEEPLPYSLVDGDTIYTLIDSFPVFTGEQSLSDYYEEKLTYPQAWKDSCRAGILEAQLLVQTDGSVKVLEITDMNDLGYDFWDQAVSASLSTFGMWKPARYQGRDVPYAFSIAIPFLPEDPQCSDQVERFETARQLENEARSLLEEEKTDEALAKLDEAIGLLPEDASLLLFRGEIYLNQKEYEKACTDIGKARAIASTDWYSEVLSIFCK